MTQEEAVEFCLSLPGAYQDWPFGEDSTVVRHSANRKIFALFLQHDRGPCLNLKCEPMQANFWRQIYTGVAPGYHMNKVHWNTIKLASDVPDDELQNMIRHSHALTAPKRQQRKQKSEAT